jgi:pimeloyl-ACP methyl ester carboxylesterase
MIDFVTRLAELPDTSLPYVEVGEGAPVVFMHGALGDWRTWTATLQHMPRTCRAIAFTQRWFGGERREHGAVSFGTRQQADDLIAFLDALSLSSAHVVAWSFSAHSALAAAARFPDRMLSLHLYDLGFPTFVDDPGMMSAIADYGDVAFAPVVKALQGGDRVAAVRALIDASAGCGYFDRQPARLRDVHLSNAHSIELLLNQTPPEPLRSADLRNMRVPTRIAWGELSGSYRLVSVVAAQLVPDCKAMEVPGANHLWPEVAPEQFAQFAVSGIMN